MTNSTNMCILKYLWNGITRMLLNLQIWKYFLLHGNDAESAVRLHWAFGGFFSVSGVNGACSLSSVV